MIGTYRIIGSESRANPNDASMVFHTVTLRGADGVIYKVDSKKFDWKPYLDSEQEIEFGFKYGKYTNGVEAICVIV